MQNFKLPVFEKWEDLTLANNFIFCKVMEENPDVAKELLELLLDIKIDRLEKPQSEKQFKTDFVSRGIRFDVYVKDGSGRSFDIEIQTSHFLNLSKRARYYQGLMDVDNVHSGVEYEVLKESYVIFLCLGDAIGKGLPVYTFRYRADEDNSILMNDGTVNVFFNVRMYDKMKSPKLKAFCEYLCGQESDTAFTDRLSALVARLKLNAQRRHEYMTWEQELKIQARYLAQEIAPEFAKDMAKDLAKDIAKNMAQELAEEKVQESAIETAKNLFELNLSPEQIAKATGLPLNKILELQKELQPVKV